MKKFRCKRYTVDLMSRVLKVSKSGYYKWLNMSHIWNDTKKNIQVVIQKEFMNSQQTYGSPRIAIELNKKGVFISKTSVARNMQELNIKARVKKKFVVTTDSDHLFDIPENLLDRNFEVDQVNKVWVSDITYIEIEDYFGYLTTVIDLGDRMVVGWHLSDNMTAENTTIAAFKKAAVNRQLTKDHNLMFHSDRGVQYACNGFTQLLSEYSCIQSMSRKGNCWDNAVAESFFKTIKVEMLYNYKFASLTQLNSFIFRYIDGWYNTQRLNSTLGYITPLQMFYLKTIKQAA